MKIHSYWRVISAFILFLYIGALFGCGIITTRPADTRTLVVEVGESLSIGDSRTRVRSMLGTPLIEATSIGVEVYRRSGRDTDISALPLPIPVPGQVVISNVLITYDEHDLVKEIARDLWIPDHSTEFLIHANGYSFVNIYDSKPDTLLAPPLTYDDFTKLPVPENECAIVLLMGECPMEYIRIDNEAVIDLSPAGGYCDYDTHWVRRGHNLYGAFVMRYVAPGSHRIDVRQRTKFGDFNAVFECDAGETVYVELEAKDTVPDTWHGVRLEGALLVSKKPTQIMLDTGIFHLILWHQGNWYGLSENMPTRPE
jgi:hypothetical protein